MYIYKITVIPIQKVYIGLDTKPSYKQSRWKDHQRDAFRSTTKSRKIHDAIRAHGIEACTFEIIEDGFTTIGQLALAEIRYIKEYDSYRNGLNSTPGGDGLGRTNLTLLTEEEIKIIRATLGDSFREYNKKKWANTTPEQRRAMVANSFTPEVCARRSETLKKYYDNTPNAKKDKRLKLEAWQRENRERFEEINRSNGLKGAAKVSKQVTVDLEDGTSRTYNSISEFQRETGIWMSTLKIKSKFGEFYRGYKLKEIN